MNNPTGLSAKSLDVCFRTEMTISRKVMACVITLTRRKQRITIINLADNGPEAAKRTLHNQQNTMETEKPN